MTGPFVLEKHMTPFKSKAKLFELRRQLLYQIDRLSRTVNDQRITIHDLSTDNMRRDEIIHDLVAEINSDSGMEDFAKAVATGAQVDCRVEQSMEIMDEIILKAGVRIDRQYLLGDKKSVVLSKLLKNTICRDIADLLFEKIKDQFKQKQVEGIDGILRWARR